MLKKLVLPLFILICLSMILGACSDKEASGDKSGDFPKKSVELVVPFDAGGGTDAVARTLASHAEKHFDESIAVLNVSGGGGAVGMTQVANEDADGYKLLMATVELTTLPPMGLSEVTHEDFQAIAQINLDPGAITVRSDSQWKTAEEFIEYAKAHPGELKIGNAGTGSIWHLVAASIEKTLGIEFNHIPYDGAAPAVTALLSGEVDAVTVSPAEVLTQVEAGDLSTLVVTSDERVDIMPDVPTAEEAGLGEIVSGTWRGVVAPKGLPEDVVKALEDAFVKGAEEPEFAEFMKKNGLGMKITGAKEFQEWMATSAQEWAEIIEGLGL